MVLIKRLRASGGTMCAHASGVMPDPTGMVILPESQDDRQGWSSLFVIIRLEQSFSLGIQEQDACRALDPFPPKGLGTDVLYPMH